MCVVKERHVRNGRATGIDRRSTLIRKSRQFYDYLIFRCRLEISILSSYAMLLPYATRTQCKRLAYTPCSECLLVHNVTLLLLFTVLSSPVIECTLTATRHAPRIRNISRITIISCIRLLCKPCLLVMSAATKSDHPLSFASMKDIRHSCQGGWGGKRRTEEVEVVAVRPLRGRQLHCEGS